MLGSSSQVDIKDLLIRGGPQSRILLAEPVTGHCLA